MLGWLFRKKSSAPAATPLPAPVAGPGAGAAAKKAVAGKTPSAQVPKPVAPVVDWTARLAQAAGDDDALLALLHTAALPLALKQAAVEQLGSEAALAVAERSLRNRDRRVHQLAKRRLQVRVTQRQTREQAAQLIAAAQQLATEPQMAVNRSVELDRAWQALDMTAIGDDQRAAFAALTAQLATLLQQRADAERQHKRWLADAAHAARQLHTANTSAAAGSLDRAALAMVASSARAVAQALAPADDHAAALHAAHADLQLALRSADALDVHLAVLERLLHDPASGPSVAAAADGVATDTAPAGAMLQGQGAQRPQAAPAALEALALDATPEQKDVPEAQQAQNAEEPHPAQAMQPSLAQPDPKAAWQALPPLPDVITGPQDRKSVVGQ